MWVSNNKTLAPCSKLFYQTGRSSSSLWFRRRNLSSRPTWRCLLAKGTKPPAVASMFTKCGYSTRPGPAKARTALSSRTASKGTTGPCGLPSTNPGKTAQSRWCSRANAMKSATLRTARLTPTLSSSRGVRLSAECVAQMAPGPAFSTLLHVAWVSVLHA